MGTFPRRMLAFAAVAAIALSFALMTRPVLATHVTPTVIDGNASCGQLNVAYDHEFKIDETPETKTYSDPNSDFEVDITVNDGATEMSFSSNLPVDAVFVKGGNEGGNLYVYDPPVTEDSGLTTPTNQQISHVSFCFNDVPDESVEQSVAESVEESVAESEEESVAESVEESGEQSVEAGTGTPEESAPDGALSLNGVGPLPTIAFSLILLASLGALAYANVKSVRS
jgi:hypothetical protein